MLRRDELVLASIVEVTARWWAWTRATAWTGSWRLPTDKRDHQARCASSAARTGATSPTCGATTIAARPPTWRAKRAPQPLPRRNPSLRGTVISTTSNRRGAPRKEGCGKLLECSMLSEAGVVWRYDVEQQGNPRTPRQRCSTRESGCSAMPNVRVGHNVPTTAPRQRCDSRNPVRSNIITDSRVSGWRTA